MTSVVALGAMIACLGPETASAASGSNVMAKTKTANAGINRCAATTKGQALVDCVGNVMGNLATGVNRGEVPTKAPQILSLAREAAEIRGAPKAQALRVLNRVAAIARGLASKNAGDFKPAYNAIAGAFAKAASVINRKA